MSLFSQIGNYLTKNRRTIITILFALVYIYGSIDNSFAGEGDTPGITNASKDNNGLVIALNSILKMAAMLLGMLTFLIGLFLNPEWTSGSFLGLLDPLKTMWILISNIVYFVFAFLFIWIAFMNIIGKGENYQLKQAIPKFIVGILIVPFSWFIVQFVVSLSNVLTITVLTLPYDTFKGTDFFSDEKLESIKFCDRYKFEMGETKVNEKGEIQLPITCIGNQEGVSLKDFVSAEDSKTIYGIISFYTYGVMSLDSQGAIFQQDLKTINNIINLSVKLIFDMIFVLVYLILLVALALALFVRGVMLWLFAMFSPVFGLLYFFKKPGEGFGEGSSKSFNILQMVKLAMVPVYVAGALSFGLLFIFIAGNGIDKAPSDAALKMKNGEASIGKVTFEITDGSIGDQNSPSKKLINGFQNTLGQLLLQLLGLGILWMAVMAALHSSEITNSVTHPIAEFGKSIGDLIKKAPTYAPILPGGVSAQGISKIGKTFESIPEQRLNKNMADPINKIQQKFGISTVDAHDMAEFRNKMTNGIENLPEFNDLRKMYLDGVEKLGHNNPQVQEMRNSFIEALKSPHLSSGVKSEISRITGVSDLSKLTSDLRDVNSNKVLMMTPSEVEASKLAVANTGGQFKNPMGSSSGGGGNNSPIVNTISGVTGNSTTININSLNAGTTIPPISITKGTNGKLSTGLDNIVKGFQDGGYSQKHNEAEFRKTLKETLLLHDDDVNSVISKLGSGFFNTQP